MAPPASQGTRFQDRGVSNLKCTTILSKVQKGIIMARQPILLLLITTFIGGLVGGMLGEWLSLSEEVHAQKTNSVNAEEFLLIDQNGRARAGLGLDPNGEVGLVLTSRDGSRTLALSPDGPVAVKLTDRSGRVLWSAP